MQTVAELCSIFPRGGRVEWIGISEAPHGPIHAVDEVFARPGTGIDGEHHARGGNSKRQVTLIQFEHLPVVASLLGMAANPDGDGGATGAAVPAVDPRRLRRNLVVSGINLLALRDRRFRVGAALLEGTGSCAPCSRMESELGPGGYNAMRGHGGITAIVLEGGPIRVGDPVTADDAQ